MLLFSHFLKLFAKLATVGKRTLWSFSQPDASSAGMRQHPAPFSSADGNGLRNRLQDAECAPTRICRCGACMRCLPRRDSEHSQVRIAAWKMHAERMFVHARAL